MSVDPVQRHGGVGAAPVQPDEYDDERLDRLLGDQDLLLHLQLSNYADEEWRPIAEEFARYGNSVWRAWIATGRAFTETSKVVPGRLEAPSKALTEDEVADLVTDVVVDALRAFRNDILPSNKWDPRKGANLKTYFIGQCKFRFAERFRALMHQRQKAIPTNEIDTEVLPTVPSPEADLLDQQDRADVIATMTTQIAQRIANLVEYGYEHAEIAAMVGLPDARAVVNALHYQRRVRRRTNEDRNN